LTACAIATVLSRRVHRESIYTEELRRRGSRWAVQVVSEPEPPPSRSNVDRAP